MIIFDFFILNGKFRQVDWENLVGVVASVSITGAFRFSGVDVF
jgi:hypothetical protein